MHKKRLLKLVDLLEKNAKNKRGMKFDMTMWGEKVGKSEMGVNCRTVGCALGLAALSGEFKRQGLRYEIESYNEYADDKKIEYSLYIYHKNGGEGTEAAACLFDINSGEATWLFTPDGYSKHLRGARGELEVAKRIRDFVAEKIKPPFKFK